MLKIEEFVTPSPDQWMITIKGMRNAMNSWDRMDSYTYPIDGDDGEMTFRLGLEDEKLAMRLNKGGSPHAKYRRMLPIHVTINAPLYWWKEFETYRIGVASNPSDIEFNSCSTMHRIHAKEFEVEDFSVEHLLAYDDVYDTDDKIRYCDDCCTFTSPFGVLMENVAVLNKYRDRYLETKDKKYWWQMIQLLPSSYMQKRTVSMNYQVGYELYTWRNPHKLDEWAVICRWLEELPNSELITGERE